MPKLGANITDPALLGDLPVGTVLAYSLQRSFIKIGPDLYSSGTKAFSAAMLARMGAFEPGLIVLSLG